ncbi:MAG: biotin--[Ruminococcus sp.]|nr:biotin--[acetyl-CoA-carboxylase] ligase [Ruminococcus sp.]
MKEKIIHVLKGMDGFVSGQQLCEFFGVSRTAVWKAIKALKAEGYNIESVTNKGYRLVSSPDIISEIEVKSCLKTDVFGRNITVLESVGSTNDYLKSIAPDSPAGTVVTAREQTKGKGRLGRTWESKMDDSLCFSVLLRPAIAPRDVSAVTPLCGLAVVRALNEYFDGDFEAEIKWPNDIIVGNKKICGILTEMSCETDRVDYIVVGIGINVLNKSFPQEIAYKATSCTIESDRLVNKSKLLALILKKMEKILTNGDYRFNHRYMKMYKDACATLDRTVTFYRKNEEIVGTATDISKEGELIVTLDDGTEETVLSGEVTVQGIY